MPWFWSDEVAAFLVANGKLNSDAAAGLIEMPVAFRSDAETVEEVVVELAENGEIPLAA